MRERVYHLVPPQIRPSQPPMSRTLIALALALDLRTILFVDELVVLAANARRKRGRGCFQEAFRAAFLGLKELRDAGRCRAWIFGIVANVCRYRLRHMREGYFHDELGGRMVTGFTLEEAQPSAEAVFETRKLHRVVSDAI